MPDKTTINKIITFCIAAVWFVNGLFCKVLDLVPRHEQIVAGILGGEYSYIFTKAIGVAEIFMAIWVLSGIRSRLNAVLQITLVATMNILEFFLVPDLLLFGKANAIMALCFILIIYFREFSLHKKVALGV